MIPFTSNLKYPYIIPIYTHIGPSGLKTRLKLPVPPDDEKETRDLEMQAGFV